MEKVVAKGNMSVGNPLKLIILFAVPLLIGNVFQQLYSMADSIIVGKTIGKAALAAVGSTGSIVFLVMGIIQGLTGGFSVITAQHFGASDTKGVRRSVATSILLATITGVILTVVFLFLAKPLLELMQTPADIIEQAALYTWVIYAGTLALIFYNMFSNIMRSLGDSRTPLIFLIVASLINIGLDFLFILVFKMGVEGAAYATIIAQGISAACCLVYMLVKYKEYMPKREDWKLDAKNCLRHFKVGIPMSFQFAIIAVGIMILQAALNGFGTDYIAAFTAASKIDQLATQPLVSIGTAMATYTAQNFGAGKFDRIKKGVLTGFVVNMSLAILGLFAMFFFGGSLSVLFLDVADSAVIEIAASYLKIVPLFYPVLSCIFVFRNTVQGMGDGIAPMIAGVVELALRSAGAWLLAVAIGFTGICLSGPLAWIGGAAVLIPSYFLIIKKNIKRQSEAAAIEAVEAAKANQDAVCEDKEAIDIAK